MSSGETELKAKLNIKHRNRNTDKDANEQSFLHIFSIVVVVGVDVIINVLAICFLLNFLLFLTRCYLVCAIFVQFPYLVTFPFRYCHFVPDK